MEEVSGTESSKSHHLLGSVTLMTSNDLKNAYAVPHSLQASGRERGLQSDHSCHPLMLLEGIQNMNCLGNEQM
jgi:hypothetical protein